MGVLGQRKKVQTCFPKAEASVFFRAEEIAPPPETRRDVGGAGKTCKKNKPGMFGRARRDPSIRGRRGRTRLKKDRGEKRNGLALPNARLAEGEDRTRSAGWRTRLSREKKNNEGKDIMGRNATPSHIASIKTRIQYL